MKRKPTGENLASYTSEGGLISRIYKELKNKVPKKDSFKKWTTDLNRQFSRVNHP